MLNAFRFRVIINGALLIDQPFDLISSQIKYIKQLGFREEKSNYYYKDSSIEIEFLLVSSLILE